MRAAALFIVVVLLASVCQASGPVVPVLTLTIAPPSQHVDSSANESVIVIFTGNASVQKLSMVRCVVTLTSAVDTGWPASISPATMVFISSTPQQYTVTVTVPQGTPSMVGNLTVNGRAVANGFQSVTSVKALIDLHGVPILNQTASNQTAKHSTGGVGGAGGMNNIVIAAVGVGVIAAGGAAGFYMLRRRKNRQAEMAMEKAAEPQN